MKKSTGFKPVGFRIFSAPYIPASLLLLVCALTVLLVVVGVVLEERSCGHGTMGPIPEGPGMGDVPRFIGTPAVPKPLAPKEIPRHPFMAECGGPHIDSYNSDVSDWGGPLGNNPEVLSRSMGHRFASSMLRTF